MTIKTREIPKVPKNKIGRVNKNGVKPEPAEENTFNYLTLFGFSIELIHPTSATKVKNPDILILGSIWEVKTPTSFSQSTIKKRFREASKQATKIVFDLRFVKKYADRVEKQIIGMFEDSGRVHRLMIIEKDGKLLDMIK